MKKALKRSLSLLLAITIIMGSAYVGLAEVDFGSINITNPFAVKVNAASESDMIFTLNNDGESYSVRAGNKELAGELVVPSVYNGLPVTEIGENAFAFCDGLTSVVIPDSVLYIGSNAFSYCTGILFIDLGEGLTSIGHYAFRDCTSLTSITIPNSVTSIGDNAFWGCTSLKLINVLEDNARYSSVDGVLFDKNKTYLILYPSGKNYTEYVFPDGVTTIGDYAFYGCTSLTSVTIPDSVTSIDSHAFYDCTSLALINVEEGNAKYSSIDGVLFDKNKTSLIRYPSGKNYTEYVIPDSVTSIGYNAFSGCTSLTTITIPNSVTFIGSGAFWGCTSLKSITIPDSVIDSIQDVTFSGCTSLESVIIGDNVWGIGGQAFCGCKNLKTIIIPDSVTLIANSAFMNCTSLESITISDGVTEIGHGAFYGCSSIESISIPEGVKSIEPTTFYSCSNLKSVDLPNTLTSIGDWTFAYCTNLNSINIPYGVTSIGERTFSSCSALGSITIPDSVTYIDFLAFESCVSLTELTIPDSVTSIGNAAFSGCTGLKDVYYKGSEEQWKNISFGSRNGFLTSANIHYNSSGNDEIPDSPEYVPNGTFKCVDFEYSGENGFDYDDAYFDKPATEYNHELATMSLCLALSTFRDKEDSENSADNVISVLKQCGFKNEKYDTLTTEPGTDSIGYIIGHKKIKNSETQKEETLIVVAVRSGGYEKEWASNVTLGESGDHNGFNDAANQVLGIEENDEGSITKTGKGILGYIEEYNKDAEEGNKIKGDVKFWITGYSRGAATATQTAAKLNFFPIENVNFTKEDIYAYGFATPAGAIKDSDPTNLDKYGNIFNILNFHDLVPRVAPKLWKFARYGKTYYLPFRENAWKTTLEKENEVIDWFNDRGIVYEINNFIPVYSDIPGSFLPISNDTIGVFSRKFINELAFLMKGRYSYSIQLEDSIRMIWEKEVPVTIGLALDELNDILRTEFYLHPQFLATAILANTKLIEAHSESGAYYLGWMQTMPKGLSEDEYIAQGYFNNGDSRHWLFNCPVDVYVYDKEGNLVAAIENDMPVEIESAPFSYGVDENGQKYIYLPVDGEYDVKAVAREDCKTTCTVNEFSGGSFTESRVVTFTEIPMEKGEELSVSTGSYTEDDIYNGTEDGSSAEYTITKENGEVLESNVDVAGEEVEDYTYNVIVEYDENKGIVYGGGEFTIGQFCQVTAENKPGYKFSKWTVNGETVSTETTYRFAVTEDVTLVAEYVPCEHPKYKSEVVAPTCTVDGYTKHTCEVCTHSYNDNIVKSNGHSSSNWIIDEDKHTMHTECTICKEVIETKNITVATTKLTSCYNEVKGVQLKWNAVSGAKSYKVYRKLPSQTEWIEIKSTTALEYQDTNVTGNTVYQYSVKAVDQYGNESDYSPQRECRFIETPTLLSRTNAVGGVTIKWKKVEGATSYRIYRRGAGVNYWYYLGDFPATLDTFTDLETANYFPDDASKNALAKPKSGNYYRYTVRASYDGEDSTGKDYLIYSGFDTNGLYLKYVATPKLTSISNATNGLQIKWNAVVGGGPVEYRVYRRGAGSTYWYYLGTTTNTTWTDSGVKVANGGYYRYTVRAVAGTNGKGWYSAFDTTGLYLMRLANPTLTSAVSTTSGITVKWSAIKGTTGYYVYRKTANSGWTRIGTVGGTNNTTFLDKTAKKGTTYTYTVRAVYGATTSAYNAGISCYDKY